MSLALFPHARIAAGDLQSLETALTRFYRHPPESYYRIANQNADCYDLGRLPFHLDLLGRVLPGASVLEMGCGTAHLCPHVEHRGGTYYAVDHSEELLAQNRRAFPRAHFFTVGSLPPMQFDVVVSLYTIEHLAHPTEYLREMWNRCRSGGLLAIICPEFIDCGSLPPSVYFGRTPRRFREKVRTLDLRDAADHLFDLLWHARHWQRQAQAAAPGMFWMNLRPRVLHGADYTIDADAVHLVRRIDLVWFLQEIGAEILQTSAGMPEVDAGIRRYNAYILARKSGHSPETDGLPK